MDLLYNIGIQIIQWLQSMSPALDGVMKFITFLGTVNFYMLLIPFVYWVIDTRLGFRLLLILIGADFLAAGFKQLLRQPRPYWIGDVKVLSEETSYGIPSSHASDSLAVWGYLAYRLNKGWLWAFGAVTVLLIGLSRMYLAVHFPTDVLFGWLIGLVVIVIFALCEQRVVSILEHLSPGRQIAVAFAASLLVILVGWMINQFIGPFSNPPEWVRFALNARGYSQNVTLAGSLFGASAGYVLMRSRIHYQTDGTAWQFFVRYLLGIAGVLVIYLGLDMLFGLLAADESALGYILRYLRYGAVAFWGIYVAPWIFLKLGLAKSAKWDPAGEMSG
jgi:membrane-associated phospholipid phosphatase